MTRPTVHDCSACGQPVGEQVSVAALQLGLCDSCTRLAVKWVTNYQRGVGYTRRPAGVQR